MDRCLRIAWDNSLAGRDLAGTGAYAAGLLRELSKIPELHVEVFSGWDATNQHSGLLTSSTRTLTRLVWSHGRLPQLLRRGRFDLLHSPAFVAPLACPCPIVVTVHDLAIKMFPDYFDWRWRAYINATLPSVLRAGSAVICVSEYSRQELLRFYKIPPERVHVVYNGIDHTCYNPAATLDFAWSQNLGLQRGYLLHVGALSHRKNIPTLLQAVAILRSRGKWTNRQLVLAGPRIPSLPGMAAIHDTILELDLSGSVLLTGRVPDQHMPALYVHASILVMPSLYEGFGFPALEAMACGTPVVASNMSSLPEITGDAALLVSPTDADALAAAIEGVMEHRSLAEELRRKGLERARQFSWQRTATETAAIYHIAAKS